MKEANQFENEPRTDIPGEPFELVSDVLLGSGVENVGSVSQTSYSIEYSATDGRGEIRNLLADTFQINNNNNDQPSPGPSFPSPEEVTNNEFFAVDLRPVIGSDVTQERSDSGSNYGSSINSYTSFLSRPDLWRPSDGGMYEVAGIADLKHYSFLPPQETRMAEVVWPGTEVGTATGTISSSDPTKITNVSVSFGGQPSTCNGVSPGYTIVYEGDLVHDSDKSATATNGFLQRNTRIEVKSGSTYILNKPHTYTGSEDIIHIFKIRRIGPSKIDREYGYYAYHYYLDEGSSPSSPEDFKLTKEYTSEYSYAYYYGKKPDGSNKTGSSPLGAAGVDGNTSRYTSYNTTGRWGVYVDAEVKNYLEGRTFIGHNQGIGIGGATATINGNANTLVQPDPILSVFNNRFKNQKGEIDIGSSNCPGILVEPHGDYDFDQYQMGLYVEDIAAIGTRPDIRYRLSVDGTTSGAGILGKFTGITSTRAAYFKGVVDVAGNMNVIGTMTATTLSASSIEGTISGSSVSGDIGGNAATATKLKTPVTIWGQSFDGSSNISGNLTGVGNLTSSGAPIVLNVSPYSWNFGTSGALRPGSDNAQNCGTSDFRWISIFAVNGTIQTSDKREKVEVKDSILGADFIRSLKPVSYKWKVGQNIVDETSNITERPGLRTHWGFVAQDVKESIDSFGVDFGGWILTDPENPESSQGLRYDQFIAPLTKALQEALQKIDELENKVKRLEDKVN
jgi:hypothetical protein